MWIFAGLGPQVSQSSWFGDMIQSCFNSTWNFHTVQLSLHRWLYCTQLLPWWVLWETGKGTQLWAGHSSGQQRAVCDQHLPLPVPPPWPVCSSDCLLAAALERWDGRKSSNNNSLNGLMVQLGAHQLLLQSVTDPCLAWHFPGTDLAADNGQGGLSLGEPQTWRSCPHDQT